MRWCVCGYEAKEGSYRYDFYAFACEFLGSWLGGVTCDGADLELFRKGWVGEDGFDNGTTLVASRTEDCDDFGHGWECFD